MSQNNWVVYFCIALYSRTCKLNDGLKQAVIGQLKKGSPGQKVSIINSNLHRSQGIIPSDQSSSLKIKTENTPGTVPAYDLILQSAENNHMINIAHVT